MGKTSTSPATAKQAATSEPASPVVHEGVVETPAKTAEPLPNPAAWMHERIVRQIVDFEKALNPDQEIGGRFVQGPNNESLHIENVANWGPDMIIFMGHYSDGRKFELIQHYTQINLFLVAVRKMNEEPRRIGFELLKTVKDLPQPWADPVT